MIRLARAAAPALDLIVRTLLDEGKTESVEGLVVTFHPSSLGVEIRPRPEDFESMAELVIEAFTRDAWGMITTFDNGNAVTGKAIGWRFSHPITRTRVGGEAQGRPKMLKIEFEMPDRSISLDGATITRWSNEAYNVVNDLLTQQAVKEMDSRVKPLGRAPFAILDDDDETDNKPSPATWGLVLDSDTDVVSDVSATQPLHVLDEDDDR